MALFLPRNISAVAGPAVGATGAPPASPEAGGPVALRGLHLTRTYGKGDTRTVAVDDVCIEALAGQVTLLIGPSGSGKSTLLAVLSGLTRPDRGQVLALGQDVWAMSDARRDRFRLQHCGFVFQEPNLFPALTARQQLELVLRWGPGLPRREARRRADGLLGLLGLARQAHLRPGQLSGGEKQRVAVARALIKGPQLIFADEPTSSVDWARGEQIIGLLRGAAHDRGATVLMVAHDLRIAPHADRVLLMEDGRLKPTPEIRQRDAAKGVPD